MLCVGGTGQNGATLVSMMLGRLPGFVAVGELGRIWDKGLLENQLCGCGVEFRGCPFWARVGELAFGGWDAVDGYEAARLRESVRMKRRIRPLPRRPIPELRQLPSRQALPFLLLSDLWPEHRASRRRYAALMRRLYDGIGRASGGAVIVDSMKVPYHVFLVRGIRGLDVRVLHLVRDSRGVAYSNLKWVRKQSQRSGKVYRGRRHPAKTGLRWATINLAFHVLAMRGVRVSRARYESVVRSPRDELARIADFAGSTVGSKDLAFVRGNEADLPPDHLVAGNRVRLESGPVKLRVDDEWRERLDPRQRRLVAAITWPLLKRYGYDVG